MWPADPATRAWARSDRAEMHSGFGSLRNDMTMCIRERVDVRPWSAALAADIARVERDLERGAGGASARAAISYAAASRSPTCSTRRWRFASARMACTRTALPYRVSRGAPRASVPARMGSRGAGRPDGGRGRRAPPALSRQDQRRPDERHDGSSARVAGADSFGRGVGHAAAHPRRRHQGLLRRAATGRRPRHDGTTPASSTTIRPSSSSRRAPERSLAQLERTMRASGTDARLRAAALRRRRPRSAASSRRACPDRGGRTRVPCATSSSACASSTGSARTWRSAAG